MRFEGLFERKTRCINGKFMQTVRSSANAALSLILLYWVGAAVERDPGVFLKTHLILSCRPLLMSSNGAGHETSTL